MTGWNVDGRTVVVQDLLGDNCAPGKSQPDEPGVMAPLRVRGANKNLVAVENDVVVATATVDTWNDVVFPSQILQVNNDQVGFLVRIAVLVL